LSKEEQWKLLKAGAECVIGSPGRMMDILEAKGTNLLRCTFLVLDEADRMFEMGFEGQVRQRHLIRMFFNY
jgi:superfamily II DNA/RNA helicase